MDGEQSPKSRRLQGGEDVHFEAPEPKPELVPEEVELRIAYEDEHLLVVDKPAGVVVHPSPGHRSGTLVHGVLAHGAAGGDEERPGIVHRLDRDTSGLLVVARSDEAYERLKELVKGPWPRADLHGARPRPPALEEGPDRGADRPRPPRPDPPVPEHGQPARGGDALRAAGAARPARAPPRRPGDRAGPTRSASTWARSACRSSATRCTARRTRLSGASSSTRRASHSTTR